MNMELADKLLALRKQKAWTQATAAKNIAIQQSYLSKLENGHYQPSGDVIEKLCSAYDVSEGELIPQPKRVSKRLSLWLSLAILGFILIINAHFTLTFPQTYYTYKAQPLVLTQGDQLSIDYHLVDEYKGEIYIENFYGSNYEFTLVAQREITRSENRWLIALGVLLLSFAVGRGIIIKLKIARPRWI